ncbi:MAG TPA: hypothetical protein VGB37_13525 [Candidatus Lokiarchaeia archaeon]
MEKEIGLSSFIISLILCFLCFIFIPLLIWNSIASGTVSSLMAAVFFGLIALFLAIVGTIIGIIGAVKDESKKFAIIGLVLSFICLIYLLGAITIGASTYLT